MGIHVDYLVDHLLKESTFFPKYFLQQFLISLSFLPSNLLTILAHLQNRRIHSNRKSFLKKSWIVQNKQKRASLVTPLLMKLKYDRFFFSTNMTMLDIWVQIVRPPQSATVATSLQTYKLKKLKPIIQEKKGVPWTCAKAPYAAFCLLWLLLFYEPSLLHKTNVAQVFLYLVLRWQKGW